ncbi:hypothetical protein HK101_000304, partial [Irineochytrium annulatum]
MADEYRMVGADEDHKVTIPMSTFGTFGNNGEKYLELDDEGNHKRRTHAPTKREKEDLDEIYSL